MPLAFVPSAGRKLRASELLEMVTQINALTSTSWTSYGAAGTIITSATTSPTLGNTTWSAKYRQPAGSDVIDFRMSFTIGSTFVAGSGEYLFLLPVAASADAVLGTTGAMFLDDNGTALRVGTAIIFDTTHLKVYRESSTASIGNGGPGTAWATGDRIKISGRYSTL